jgi:hypothetical protein
LNVSIPTSHPILELVRRVDATRLGFFNTGDSVEPPNSSVSRCRSADVRMRARLGYAPNAYGQPKLAALEYIVFASAWTAAGHTGPPELLGQPFFFSPDGNRFGIPAHCA